MIKDKLIYLTKKVKELLGFGAPVTSVNLDGAQKISDLESNKEDIDLTSEEKDDNNDTTFDPLKMGEQALNEEIELAKS